MDPDGIGTLALQQQIFGSANTKAAHLGGLLVFWLAVSGLTSTVVGVVVPRTLPPIPAKGQPSLSRRRRARRLHLPQLDVEAFRDIEARSDGTMFIAEFAALAHPVRLRWNAGRQLLSGALRHLPLHVPVAIIRQEHLSQLSRSQRIKLRNAILGLVDSHAVAWHHVPADTCLQPVWFVPLGHDLLVRSVLSLAAAGSAPSTIELSSHLFEHLVALGLPHGLRDKQQVGMLGPCIVTARGTLAADEVICRVPHLGPDRLPASHTTTHFYCDPALSRDELTVYQRFRADGMDVAPAQLAARLLLAGEHTACPRLPAD